MGNPSESEGIVTLKERFDIEYGSDGYGWKLSEDLFGYAGSDINDFDMQNYTYFLDNVRTLEDLVKGLKELSPLVDDALLVAESMTKRDFYRFKKALPEERAQSSTESDGRSRMPFRFQKLLLPRLVLDSIFFIDTFQIPMGAMMILLLAREEKLVQIAPASI